MELEPAETILITGGAGMVGQAAAAIARSRGAQPIVADRRRPNGNAAEAYQTMLAGSAGIKQVLLPLGGGANSSEGNRS